MHTALHGQHPHKHHFVIIGFSPTLHLLTWHWHYPPLYTVRERGGGQTYAQNNLCSNAIAISITIMAIVMMARVISILIVKS